MHDNELNRAQKEYRQFDVRRGAITKTLIVILVAILICFIAAFQVADKTSTPILLFFCILIIYAFITIFICRHLARTHSKLYAAAHSNDADIIRTGLFGELWEECAWNQFEGLTDGKIIYVETYHDTIDLLIIRNKHEFSIQVDNESIHMICDEETDTPIEKSIPLAELKDVAGFYLTVRTFIESIA